MKKSKVSFSQRIRNWFWKYFFIGETVHSLHFADRVQRSQLNFLLRNSNRRMRRKWARMLNNSKSPFYISRAESN
jgi:hypothetical protein